MVERMGETDDPEFMYEADSSGVQELVIVVVASKLRCRKDGHTGLSLMSIEV